MIDGRCMLRNQTRGYKCSGQTDGGLSKGQLPHYFTGDVTAAAGHVYLPRTDICEAADWRDTQTRFSHPNADGHRDRGQPAQNSARTPCRYRPSRATPSQRAGTCRLVPTKSLTRAAA